MNQEEVDNFLTKFNKEILQARKFCYFVRGIEFQKEALFTLDKFCNEIIHLQEKVISLEDEDKANILLACILLLKAVYYELKMWIALKEDNADSAWDNLMNAQSSMTAAIKAHNIAEQNEFYLNNLHTLEGFLFPPQTFSSAGYIVYESECTICGMNYELCDHIMGKPYMGKLCSRKINKCEILEVSVVKEPANKRCRVTSFSEGNLMRDIMTWKIVERENK